MRWLTGTIFAPVATSVGREVALVLFVVAIFCCCFIGVDYLRLLLLLVAAMMTLLMSVGLLMIVKAVLLFLEYRIYAIQLY